jgi:hypothetical protein
MTILREKSVSDHTPTTAEVREAFVELRVDHSNQSLTPEDAEAAFDRWLSAHDAEVIAARGSKLDPEAHKRIAGHLQVALDAHMVGLHTLYDVAKVLPHPYDAFRGMASKLLHDFAGTGVALRSYILLNSPKLPE